MSNTSSKEYACHGVAKNSRTRSLDLINQSEVHTSQQLIDKALLINLLGIKRAFNITAKDYTRCGVTIAYL